jgi:hypothetical protein
MQAETGRGEDARRALDEQLQQGFARLRSMVFGSADRYLLLADAAIATNHSAAAEPLYDLLLPVGDLYIWSGPSLHHGTAARGLGNLATLLERRRATL